MEYKDDEEHLDEEELLLRAVNETAIASSCSIPASFQLNDMELGVRCIHANDLTENQKQRIFDILRNNMKTLYEASNWGWNEKAKSSEVFHRESRFLLLTDIINAEVVHGYVMFRFEWDDEDEPEYPVLYCYELQIHSSIQRQGAGRTLMSFVRAIAERFQMKKILLTCFKANKMAINFYQKLGFDIDRNSPSRHGNIIEDYEILSDKPNLK